MAGHNCIDPKTGTITYSGPSELTKGNHNGMPARTNAYLSTDEKGHIQASSLSGTNEPDNVVPQAADLNHGSYYSMEGGERNALKNGSKIDSEKIAYVSNQPDQRPDAFMVNDTVTYADDQIQIIHLSFSNLTNAEQEGMNTESFIKAVDMFDALPNPGDSLRSSMSNTEYAALMEETDAVLPDVQDMYVEYDASTSANNSVDGGIESASDSFSADPGEGDDGASASTDDD